MFLFNSLHQGNVVSRNRKVSSSLRSHWARSVFTLAVMFCLSTAFLFTGCNTDDNTAGNLNGTWKDNFSTIIINTSAKTISYENNYEGQIVNSPNFTTTDGVLIIKFTKYWDADYSGYPNVVYTENTTNINKFGAMYWTGLTSDQVSLADAYTGYTHTMLDTIETAQTAFTPAADKVGTYVDWSITSPYTKQ